LRYGSRQLRESESGENRETLEEEERRRMTLMEKNKTR